MAAEMIGQRGWLRIEPGVRLVLLAFSGSEKKFGVVVSNTPSNMPQLGEYCSINTTL
jgi:hypothetical protein